ncbi:SGNH/GDSL hydrolase family protein [Pedobacter nyackensis]|nr:GDSL-type esterase/lipase family protein [Pedobacter nyackensis]
MGICLLNKLVGLCLICLCFISCSSRITVLNKGVAGNNSRDLLKRIEKDVLQEKPDLVVMMVGSNDMVNSGKLVAYPEFKENYERLLKKMTSSGVTVVVMSPPPVDTAYILKRHDRILYDEPLDHKLDSLNRLVGQIAKANGIHFIDLYTLFKSKGSPSRAPGSLTMNQANFGKEDGIHPTKRGYMLIAETLYRYLKKNKLLRKSKKIICFGDSITYGAFMEGAGTSTGDTYPSFLKNMITTGQQY